MKRIVVLTGAGISAESGIKTFRDSNGLWEEHRIEDVATPQAWQRNPKLVTNFYNQRRKQVMEALPNKAHLALVEMEKHYQVAVITQNVDDLHERAGSKHIIHLHGEILKMRSEEDPSMIYQSNGWEMDYESTNDHGHRLRPHIVWFGEMVPKMDEAIYQTMKADIFLVIGTSLEVYPAAGLIDYTSDSCEKYIVDPKARELNHIQNLTVIQNTAGEGVPALVNKLIKNV
jgi:NAD-dependent deacetylase